MSAKRGRSTLTGAEKLAAAREKAAQAKKDREAASLARIEKSLSPSTGSRSVSRSRSQSASRRKATPKAGSSTNGRGGPAPSRAASGDNPGVSGMGWAPTVKRETKAVSVPGSHSVGTAGEAFSTTAPTATTTKTKTKMVSKPKTKTKTTSTPKTKLLKKTPKGGSAATTSTVKHTAPRSTTRMDQSSDSEDDSSPLPVSAAATAPSSMPGDNSAGVGGVGGGAGAGSSAMGLIGSSNTAFTGFGSTFGSWFSQTVPTQPAAAVPGHSNPPQAGRVPDQASLLTHSPSKSRAHDQSRSPSRSPVASAAALLGAKPEGRPQRPKTVLVPKSGKRSLKRPHPSEATNSSDGSSDDVSPLSAAASSRTGLASRAWPLAVGKHEANGAAPKDVNSSRKKKSRVGVGVGVGVGSELYPPNPRFARNEHAGRAAGDAASLYPPATSSVNPGSTSSRGLAHPGRRSSAPTHVTIAVPTPKHRGPEHGTSDREDEAIENSLGSSAYLPMRRAAHRVPTPAPSKFVPGPIVSRVPDDLSDDDSHGLDGGSMLVLDDYGGGQRDRSRARRRRKPSDRADSEPPTPVFSDDPYGASSPSPSPSRFARLVASVKAVFPYVVIVALLCLIGFLGMRFWSNSNQLRMRSMMKDDLNAVGDAPNTSELMPAIEAAMLEARHILATHAGSYECQGWLGLHSSGGPPSRFVASSDLFRQIEHYLYDSGLSSSPSKTELIINQIEKMLRKEVVVDVDDEGRFTVADGMEIKPLKCTIFHAAYNNIQILAIFLVILVLVTWRIVSLRRAQHEEKTVAAIVREILQLLHEAAKDPDMARHTYPKNILKSTILNMVSRADQPYVSRLWPQAEARIVADGRIHEKEVVIRGEQETCWTWALPHVPVGPVTDFDPEFVSPFSANAAARTPVGDLPSTFKAYIGSTAKHIAFDDSRVG